MPCYSLSNAMSSRIALCIVHSDLPNLPGGQTHWGGTVVPSASSTMSRKHRRSYMVTAGSSEVKCLTSPLDLGFTHQQASKLHPFCFPFLLASYSASVLKSQETVHWWNTDGWSRERNPRSALWESLPMPHAAFFAPHVSKEIWVLIWEISITSCLQYTLFSSSRYE